MRYVNEIRVNRTFATNNVTKQIAQKVNNKQKSKIRNRNIWGPAFNRANQFKMKFHVKCHIFLGLIFFLQLSQTGGKTPEELALFMQRNVERLIEKVLTQVQEYYHEIKSNAKCIPDYVPDNIMETLKKSIDCVSENERNYASGKIKHQIHAKNFLKCFSTAKKEVNKTITAIDPYEDYCPQNMTEKTYEINVTTTFTKTFQINIKNGLEVTHKEIDFSKGNCLNHISNIFDENSSHNSNESHENGINSNNNCNSNDDDDENNQENENDDADEDDNDNDSDDDKKNDKHGNDNENQNNYDYENKTNTDTTNTTEHNNHRSNDTKSDNDQDSSEETEISPEEDAIDEYSVDDYNDKDTSLDDSIKIQSQDNSKSIKYNAANNVKDSKPEVEKNDSEPFMEGVFRNHSNKDDKKKKRIPPNSRDSNKAAYAYTE